MTRFTLVTPSLQFKELEMVKSFLSWQDVEFELVEDYESLRFTNGKDCPILMQNDMIMAKGFFAIIDYMRTEGKLLCANL